MARIVYKEINGDKLLLHGKYVKWNQEINNFSDSLWDFTEEHMSIYRITNIPKYRSFQYRTIQRALVTNIDLHRWGMLESSKCSLCREEEETMLHMFVECKEITPVWAELNQYLCDKYSLHNINMSSKCVILNQLVEPKYHVVNFICLLLKQYIYRKRCLKEKISFQAFKAHVTSIQNIEKYIAQKNNRMGKYRKKWNDLRL